MVNLLLSRDYVYCKAVTNILGVTQKYYSSIDKYDVLTVKHKCMSGHVCVFQESNYGLLDGDFRNLLSTQQLFRYI